MPDQREISLNEVFNDTKARRRFLNLVGQDMLSADELDELISRGDAKELVGWLNPIYEAEWGAIHHCNSARFSLYHYNGYFFAGFDMDDGAIQGPFKTAIDAAEAYSGVLSCQVPEDDNDCVGAVGFTSGITGAGIKVVSRRKANVIFAIVSGHEGVLKHHGDEAGFDWAEVIPGKFFVDPKRDEFGKELEASWKYKTSDEVASAKEAKAKLKKLLKKQKYFDFTFDNSSGVFKSLNESYVMKIPMEGRGKLAKFPTQWVRLCLPERIGRRIKIKVGLISMHWNHVSDLVSTRLGINAS